MSCHVSEVAPKKGKSINKKFTDNYRCFNVKCDVSSVLSLTLSSM